MSLITGAAESRLNCRRYSAFISYRHADNTHEGRRWAEWLHRGLERYVVPPDLVGTPNLRKEAVRDSLYPIFRDEDELPANADLATGIRAALEVSDHLIVLCSPRSAVSPWVRKEVREFKELGRSDRILAIIIAGEPNADDPAKAREGILRDEECFCEELRFGAVREDGTLDWSVRTEPLAADLRPVGTRAEGFVTAEAYKEYLMLHSSLTPEKIAARTEAYRQQLDHALIKVAAGLLGVPLGQLIDRDAAHRAELSRKELERSHAEAARLRTFSRRLAMAGAAAFTLALLAGWFWWRATSEKQRVVVALEAVEQAKAGADKAAVRAKTARVAAEDLISFMIIDLGDMQVPISRGMLSEDEIEALAKAFSELESTRWGFPPWNQLDEETHNYYRTGALYIDVKLSAVGCRRQPISSASEEEKNFTFTPDEIEVMANMEHRRWCAKRSREGWTYGAVRDQQHKMHPDLAPWEILTESLREVDREYVRTLPGLLRRNGYAIQRYRVNRK